MTAEEHAKWVKYQESVRKANEKGKRTVAKNTLMLAKAVQAGITVSEAEIDAYLKAKGK